MRLDQRGYVRFRPGLTESECRLLDSIVRIGAEVRQLSLWCMYNANWVKKAMREGKKIA